MAILGKDVFPIHELSQHEKELQSILSSLDSIGRKMSDNRADDMEILLYQTYLIYQATLGGSIRLNPNDDPRQSAFDAVDALWRYLPHMDYDVEPESQEALFLYPQYENDVYLQAFHQLLHEHYYQIVERKTRVNFFGCDLGDYTENYERYSLAIKSFLSPYLTHKNTRILDCDASYLPPDYTFDGIGKYVIYEQDKTFFAFLVLRKALEGDSWNNVEIIHELNPFANQFDFILLGSGFFGIGDSLEGICDYCKCLSDNGHIVLHCQPLSSSECRGLIELGMPKVIVSIERPGGAAIDDSNAGLYILQKPNKKQSSVIFAEFGIGGKTLELLENYTIETLQDIDPERFISVPYKDILPWNLIPGFYLLLQEVSTEGTEPLKSYVLSNVSRKNQLQPENVNLDNVVVNVSTDSRLLETRPEHVSDSLRDFYHYYDLSQTAVLINNRRWEVGYITLEGGEHVAINSNYYAFPVDTKKIDIRFLVLYLRETPAFQVAIGYAKSENDILEFPIPQKTLQEQSQYVEEYLRKVKNEFNSKLDIKDSLLQIIVFNPDRIGFETANKERLDKLGFRVLKYVEDKSSLKEALSEHYGEKVLSSELADAVLVCADMPANDVEKAIYFIEKTGIRVFYYSDSPSYDFDKIDEDYLDDFKKGFISDKDYLERIREKMDADSNNVRDQYSKFFKAADRLDEDYGWGLAEYATSLLQGKPFKMDINKLRSKIDETIITFFKSHHIAPAEMDNTAVASLVADKKYYEGRKKVNINLTEELSKTALDSEAWYKYALVAIRKLGNKDSHSSSDSDSSLELAAFTLFTEIIVWLDSVRERYKEKKCLFVIKKGNVELPFYTVEEYQVDGKDYLVANGVHLIDTKRELKAGDQVVILDTEAEKYPRTINGSRVEEVAGPTNYIVAIKA